MDRLRWPFLAIAAALLLIAVLVEASSISWIGADSSADLPTPGIGIAYLALVDGILLFTVVLFGLAQLLPGGLMGATHGIVTFILMLLLLIGSIVLIFAAIALLTLMVTLLLAVPFGTIAYFAGFGHFHVGDARVTLGILMTLKVAAVICLFLAQQNFLLGKGLVLLLLSSLLANVIVSFLQGFMPVFLASILDAIAAIVVGVLAAIWALAKLIGSIPAAVNGLKLWRAA
jgi:hypothetical protein